MDFGTGFGCLDNVKIFMMRTTIDRNTFWFAFRLETFNEIDLLLISTIFNVWLNFIYVGYLILENNLKINTLFFISMNHSACFTIWAKWYAFIKYLLILWYNDIIKRTCIMMEQFFGIGKTFWGLHVECKLNTNGHFGTGKT